MAESAPAGHPPERRLDMSQGSRCERSRSCERQSPDVIGSQMRPDVGAPCVSRRGFLGGALGVGLGIAGAGSLAFPTRALAARPPRDIACWGDSLTAGNGGGRIGNNTNYPGILGDLLTDRSVYNGGVPGAQSDTVAIRQGGWDPFATAIGPVEARYEVSLFAPLNLVPTRGADNVLPGSLLSATAALEGVLIPVTTTSASCSPRLPTPKDPQPGIRMLKARIRENIRLMRQHQLSVAPDGRYLVMGLTNSAGTGLEDDLVTPTPYYRHAIRELNGALLAEHGALNYFDTHDFLVNRALPPELRTPADEDDVAHDVPPRTIRDGAVSGHLNAYGYRLLGEEIHRAIMDRGWLD